MARPKKQPAKQKPEDHDDDLENGNGSNEDNGDENENGNAVDEPVSDARSYKPEKPKPHENGGDIDVQIRKDKITITLPRDGDAPDTLNRIADLLDGM